MNARGKDFADGLGLRDAEAPVILRIAADIRVDDDLDPRVRERVQQLADSGNGGPGVLGERIRTTLERDRLLPQQAADPVLGDPVHSDGSDRDSVGDRPAGFGRCGNRAHVELQAVAHAFARCVAGQGQRAVLKLQAGSPVHLPQELNQPRESRDPGRFGHGVVDFRFVDHVALTHDGGRRVEQLLPALGGRQASGQQPDVAVKAELEARLDRHHEAVVNASHSRLARRASRRLEPDLREGDRAVERDGAAVRFDAETTHANVRERRGRSRLDRRLDAGEFEREADGPQQQ